MSGGYIEIEYHFNSFWSYIQARSNGNKPGWTTMYISFHDPKTGKISFGISPQMTDL